MGAAMGVAAGLAGGAFLMHEGEEVKEKLHRDEYRAEERFEGDKYRAEDRFEEDKYRTEERFDRFGRDVEDAPEDAARWAGRKVQDVEDIPQDIEGSFDRFGDRVERKWDDARDDVEGKLNVTLPRHGNAACANDSVDAPERIADDVGYDVGRVENFGDDIRDSYDDGRDEGRDDDRW